MLLEFRMKNFFSFREGVEVSFKLDGKCPQEISRGKNTTSILGVKGANGSGKTHLLKGLSFLSAFCAHSFNAKPEAPISVEPFFQSQEPIEFEMEFQTPKATYTYELELTDLEVLRETLYRTKKSRRAKVFERIKNDVKERTTEYQIISSVKLRSNASIISTAHQYEISLLEDVYAFFSNFYTNVSYSGLRDLPFTMESASRVFHDNETALAFVKEFISKCDIGITDIRIHALTQPDGTQEYTPVFLHESNGKLYPVLPAGESSGTKTLYRGLLLYQLALIYGGILVLDEFDINLHPHILPLLIDLFTDPERNPNGAQMIFSTHDADMLNILGKYRTYLVNKRDNESFAYRLDEIPGDMIRNDRPILPLYDEGKLGGVPRI